MDHEPLVHGLLKARRMNAPMYLLTSLALVSPACISSDPSLDEDAADAAFPDLSDPKADGLAWSGPELAGAVRAANALSRDALRAEVGLTTRATNALMAARPVRGIAALDAVRYIGPVALTRLVEFARSAGWTDGDMPLVAAGPFMMGHPSGHRFEPLHEVMMSTYWIDRFETTNAEWAACVAAGACPRVELTPYFGPGYEAMADHPITGMDWRAAAAYCTWRGKRLPSEAQWEKAARGPDDLRVYPWGTAPLSCDRANVGACRVPGINYPSAVGLRPLGASPYGVEDLIGNVSEWVSDHYNEFEPTCATPCIDPEGIPESEASPTYHGVRGASHSTIPGQGGFEVHHRLSNFWSPDLGLRCSLQ